MPVKPSYLLIGSGGALLLWSGFKGHGVSRAARDIVSGNNPDAQPIAYPITGSSGALGASNAGVGASSVGTGFGNAAANDALQYKGAGYVWGGAPANGVGNWDCSSFSNWVYGHDLRLGIPLYKAGAYNGQSHGPTTGVWLVWTGAFTIHRNDAAPGDLCVWQTHMGICIDNGQHMISALDPRIGTQVTTIDGGAPPAEMLFVRRMKVFVG